MVIQNIHYIPHLPAPVVNRGPGKTDYIAAAVCNQAGTAVFFRAGMTQLLYFIKNDRLKSCLWQNFLPSPEQQIMYDV